MRISTELCALRKCNWRYELLAH